MVNKAMINRQFTGSIEHQDNIATLMLNGFTELPIYHSFYAILSSQLSCTEPSKCSFSFITNTTVYYKKGMCSSHCLYHSHNLQFFSSPVPLAECRAHSAITRGMS